MFPLIYALINCWVNTGEAGDSRRYRARNDVIVMRIYFIIVGQAKLRHALIYKISFNENAFENIVREMSAILGRPQLSNEWRNLYVFICVEHDMGKVVKLVFDYGAILYSCTVYEYIPIFRIF